MPFALGFLATPRHASRISAPDVTEADGTFHGTDFISVDVDGDPGPILE